jgi:hypothetical protein
LKVCKNTLIIIYDKSINYKMNKYQKKSKTDLENIALIRNLSIGGSKKELIELLLKYDNSKGI